MSIQWWANRGLAQNQSKPNKTQNFRFSKSNCDILQVKDPLKFEVNKIVKWEITLYIKDIVHEKLKVKANILHTKRTNRIFPNSSQLLRKTTLHPVVEPPSQPHSQNLQLLHQRLSWTHCNSSKDFCAPIFLCFTISTINQLYKQ